MNKFVSFLKRKNVEISLKRYLIDAMSAMALGLFSTLLIGTILRTIGSEFNLPFLRDTVWAVCSQSTGAGIAFAVAYRLNAQPLVLFSTAVVGLATYPEAGPLGTFIAAIISTEIGKIISGETQLDILISPTITILIGVGLSQFLGNHIQQIMHSIGQIIESATQANPLIMSIIVAVVVGMVLTLPISSAALCLMLEMNGLAAGAATIGCCTQMIGFATISYKDNGIKGIFAQGLGTSMLQMPNIYKNWKIWIPPTLASAVISPLGILFFEMKNTAIESGMGTCGLVGQIGTYNAMKETTSILNLFSGIFLFHFILPAVISYFFYWILKKQNWIKNGDMKILLSKNEKS